MSKYAIIFPGVGYHTDKPLLYYGKKLAAECGYEIIEVPYTGFEQGIRGNADKMRAAFELALRQAKEMLADYTFCSEDEILVISKSVGTVVAGAWQKSMGLHAKHIYFTPVEATFDFAEEKSGIVFHGTNDPWVETRIVLENCEKLQLPIHLIENANHSLEQGKAQIDVDNLQKVIEKCGEYLQEED